MLLRIAIAICAFNGVVAVAVFCYMIKYLKEVRRER